MADQINDHYSLCVGYTERPEYGWRCVFEGDLNSCIEYSNNNALTSTYTQVFAVGFDSNDNYEQVNLK